MSAAMVEKDPGFTMVLALYLDAGRPREVCPCCGRWGDLELPLCTDPGWLHHESCARIRYADRLCDQCEEIPVDREALRTNLTTTPTQPKENTHA